MVGPGRAGAITCALYRTPTGLEVRAGRSAQEPLLYHSVHTSIAAEALAAVWKAGAEARGFRAIDQEALGRLMGDQILDWLRREHSDPTQRTPMATAAFLRVDESAVRRELATMLLNGAVRLEIIDGLPTYVPT